MSDVINYYNNYDEDKRLGKSNLHRIEYLTTLRYLDSIISPCSRILDTCAGTGIYSFYLEGEGHSVTAVDIVPKFVEIMEDKKKTLSSKINVHLGDARDLSMFKPESFDTVLCMGAFYHLHQEEDRKKVIEQCLSLLNEGGIIVVSYINKFAVFLNEFNRMEKYIDFEVLNGISTDGYTNDPRSESFYFSNSEEIESLMGEFNVEKITNIGTDGIGYMMGEKILNLSEEEYQFWLESHYKTCEIQSLVGYSLHGLYIGRKK